MKAWLTEFNKQINGKVNLIQSTLNVMVDDCSVSEFTEDVIDGITKIEKNLLKSISSTSWIISEMRSRSNSPEDLLYHQLIGCTETCPFCQEQCEVTNADSSHSHFIKLHRYQCLGRYVDSNTNELYFNTCSELIRSSISFKNSNTGWKLHRYDSYQTGNACTV